MDIKIVNNSTREIPEEFIESIKFKGGGVLGDSEDE